MPKISDLPAGATVDGTEKVPAVQGGVTVYLTQAQLAALVTLTDSNFTITDNGDTTKKAKFEISGIATATTRTFTLPDASGTLLYSGGPLGTPSSGTLTNCNGGQPNKGGGTSQVDCIFMLGTAGARWEDRPCTTGIVVNAGAYPFVCERD